VAFHRRPRCRYGSEGQQRWCCWRIAKKEGEVSGVEEDVRVGIGEFSSGSPGEPCALSGVLIGKSGFTVHQIAAESRPSSSLCARLPCGAPRAYNNAARAPMNGRCISGSARGHELRTLRTSSSTEGGETTFVTSCARLWQYSVTSWRSQIVIAYSGAFAIATRSII